MNDVIRAIRQGIVDADPLVVGLVVLVVALVAVLYVVRRLRGRG